MLKRCIDFFNIKQIYSEKLITLNMAFLWEIAATLLWISEHPVQIYIHFACHLKWCFCRFELAWTKRRWQFFSRVQRCIAIM